MTPYYEQDGITIYHGDCRDVLAGFNPDSVPLIVTSPPYNLGANTWEMGGAGRRRREAGIGYDDALPPAEYQAQQVAILAALWRVAAPGASLFYNHKPRTLGGALIHPLDWLRVPAQPWIVRQELTWDRGSTHNHEPSLFWQVDERIYWLTKGRPALNGALNLPTILRVRPEGPSPHPAPFPVALPRQLIAAIGAPLVLDPYAGSGTTLRAAKDLGCQAIGIELEARYCEIAANRLRQTVLPLEVSA